MNRYSVSVATSPGHRVRHVRLIQARDDLQARQLAVQVANQWAQRSAVARYRVTWQLFGKDRVHGTLTRIAGGRLDSGRDRRRAEG